MTMWFFDQFLSALDSLIENRERIGYIGASEKLFRVFLQPDTSLVINRDIGEQVPVDALRPQCVNHLVDLLDLRLKTSFLFGSQFGGRRRSSLSQNLKCRDGE